MSGIAGFYNTAASLSRDEAETVLRRMIDSIRQRGPDDWGMWQDTRQGAGLGFCGLAGRDVSPAGRQPMASPDGRYVLVFDGRAYNCASLREELLGLGHIFRGQSDAEVLLAGIRQWGVREAARRFNGMFAFAAWDAESRALHLGRDRMGVKPLYYGWLGKTFAFGSELRALRAHPGFGQDIERDALALFLRYGYIPAPLSMYRGVYKLMPGQILTVWPGSEAGDERREAYWSPRAAVEKGLTSPFKGDEREAVDALDSLLTRSIASRRMSDAPLGVFLSGDAASVLLAALLKREDGSPAQTFSARFDGEGKGGQAQTVAARLGVDYVEMVIGAQDAQALLPRLSEMYDEPFADSSQIGAALVSQLARRRAAVCLSGAGGDILFAGRSLYFQAMRAWNAVGWMPDSWRRAAARGLRPFSNWEGMLGGLFRVFDAPAREALYLDSVSRWKQPEVVAAGGREPPTMLTDPLRWMNVASFAERMMSLDLAVFLPDDLLVNVDRAAMSAGLEVSLPFVDDHEMVEFAWSLPLRMKMRNGQGNWLLRQLLQKAAPRLRLAGIGTEADAPLAAWLRGPLREWAEDLLSEERLEREGFLRAAPIRQAWQEYLSGQRAREQELWTVLMFQAWLARNQRERVEAK